MYFLSQDPSIPEQTGLKSEIVSNFSCLYQEDTRELIELESESNIVLQKKENLYFHLHITTFHNLH